VPHPFRKHPTRALLRKLYDEVDALFSQLSCDNSAECCHFGMTGREPYPTAVELAELEVALLARPLPSKKRLAMVEERRTCPLLGADGRCGAYASRPFGCRTFFCDLALGERPPREEVQRISRAIAELSAVHAPRDPGPRPLSRALARGLTSRS